MKRYMLITSLFFLLAFIAGMATTEAEAYHSDCCGSGYYSYDNDYAGRNVYYDADSYARRQSYYRYYDDDYYGRNIERRTRPRYEEPRYERPAGRNIVYGSSNRYRYDTMGGREYGGVYFSPGSYALYGPVDLYYGYGTNIYADRFGDRYHY